MDDHSIDSNNSSNSSGTGSSSRSSISSRSRYRSRHKRAKTEPSYYDDDSYYSLFSIGPRLCRVSNETLLSEEQKLAKSNMDIWEEIGKCKTKIDYYQTKINRLHLELQRRMCLTQIMHKPSFWNELTDAHKFDREAVHVLMMQQPRRLPEKLLRALWVCRDDADYDDYDEKESSCELRHDRDILLASIDDLNHNKRIKVRLTESMIQDNELICKLAQKYPWFLLQDNIPEPLWDNPHVLRALLRNEDKFLTCENLTLQALSKFSTRLRNDPDLMLETSLAIGRNIRFFYQIESNPVEQHFLVDTLRDNKSFCLRMSTAMLNEPRERKLAGPLRYHHLSSRLQLDPQVFSAFCQVDGANLIRLFAKLRQIEDDEQEQSTVLGVQMSSDQVATMEKLLAEKMSSKEAVLKAFEDWLGGSKEAVLNAFEDGLGGGVNLVDFFLKLPVELQQDRAVAVAASAYCTDVFSSLREQWHGDRDYWIGLLEAGFDWFGELTLEILPLELQQDYQLALVLARKSKFGDISNEKAFSMFQSLLKRFPDLLLDRQVVINFVTRFGRTCCKADVCQMIPRQILDKELCLKLVQTRGELYHLLPDELRGDRDVLRALCKSCPNIFHKGVPKDIQRQHPDLVIKAIRTSQPVCCFTTFDVALELQSTHREVVLALLSSPTGSSFVEYLHDHRRQHSLFKDRDVLLKLAEHMEEDFRKFCPSNLRHDKQFMLQAVWKNAACCEHCPFQFCRDKQFMLQAVLHNPACFEHVDELLSYDFDILLALLSQDPNHEILRDLIDKGEVYYDQAKGLARFARKVRHRLQAYMSFMVFLGGISSSNGTAPCSSTSSTLGGYCSLPLLDQGTDTAMAYKKLIATYTGVPLGDELSMLRRASVGLTRWGY